VLAFLQTTLAFLPVFVQALNKRLVQIMIIAGFILIKFNLSAVNLLNKGPAQWQGALFPTSTEFN
jgi:hypothetical protein